MVSQTRTVRSSPADASVRPSGENVRPRTALAWPGECLDFRTRGDVPDFDLPDSWPAVICEPSGKNVIADSRIGRNHSTDDQ